MKKVTLSGIRNYASKLYERVFIRGVVHGNWKAEQARKSIDLILEEIKSQPLPEEERYQEVVEVLDPGKQIRFSKQIADNNNSIFYTLQVGERNFKEQAVSSMVAVDTKRSVRVVLESTSMCSWAKTCVTSKSKPARS